MTPTPLVDRTATTCQLHWDTGEWDFDGSWWPATDDITTELRSLVPAVGEHLGDPVTQVSLHICDWRLPRPERLSIDGRTVRIGWFTMLASGVVTLGHGGDARTVLHVLHAPQEALS